jgi:AcrR family transcriptional regulator
LSGLAHSEVVPRRGRRDRKATESALEAAALELLARDGILAGLNLNEVAALAGINRGLVYQCFGSRRALLRSALHRIWLARVDAVAKVRDLPFAKARRLRFRSAARNPTGPRVEAMLVLDGDPDLVMFPLLESALAALRRDQDRGDLDASLDVRAVHALCVATNLGYSIFRDQMAHELGLPPDRLDRQAEAVHARMLESLTSSSN